MPCSFFLLVKTAKKRVPFLWMAPKTLGVR